MQQGEPDRAMKRGETEGPMQQGGQDASAGGRWTLAFGLLGGAAAWTLHLLLTFVIAEFGCLSSAAHLKVAGATAISWMIVVVSIGSIGLSAASAYVALRRLRQIEAGPPGRGGAGAELYMARAGFYAGALFAIAILFQSLPILFYWGGC